MPDLPREVAPVAGGAWLIRRVLALGVALMVGGCSAPAVDSDKARSKVQTLWPAPPDQARFEYQATLRSAADILRETEALKWEKALTGRGINSKPVINKPSGIAARNGLIYLTEPSTKSVTVFDVPRRKLFSFGLRPPNHLEKPMSIALDARQRVYVLDVALRKVMIFDKLGLFEHSISLEKGYSNPVAVAASPDGETVYVVDRGDVANQDHKVVALARDGTERFRLGPRGREPGQFNIPLAAATDGAGALYVVDFGNFRIQKFDSTGKFLFTFGSSGAELGRFARPRAIALDGEGNIYVSDGGFGNVQIFDPQGQLLMPLGRLSGEPAPGHFQLIAGIAVDETGRLYVVDHYANKVEVFKRLSDKEGRLRMQTKE